MHDLSVTLQRNLRHFQRRQIHHGQRRLAGARHRAGIEHQGLALETAGKGVGVPVAHQVPVARVDRVAQQFTSWPWRKATRRPSISSVPS